MRIGKKISPLRHEGSPPHLVKGPEHDEWHQTTSSIEDSPEYIEKQLKIEKEKKLKEPIIKKEEVSTGKEDIETAKLIEEESVGDLWCRIQSKEDGD